MFITILKNSEMSFVKRVSTFLQYPACSWGCLKVSYGVVVDRSDVRVLKSEDDFKSQWK